MAFCLQCWIDYCEKLWFEFLLSKTKCVAHQSHISHTSATLQPPISHISHAVKQRSHRNASSICQITFCFWNPFKGVLHGFYLLSFLFVKQWYFSQSNSLCSPLLYWLFFYNASYQFCFLQYVPSRQFSVLSTISICSTSFPLFMLQHQVSILMSSNFSRSLDRRTNQVKTKEHDRTKIKSLLCFILNNEDPVQATLRTLVTQVSKFMQTSLSRKVFWYQK